MNFRMPVCVVFRLMWVLLQPTSVFSDPFDLNNLSNEQQSLKESNVSVRDRGSSRENRQYL